MLLFKNGHTFDVLLFGKLTMEEGGGLTLYFCSVLMNQTIQNYGSKLHLSRFVRDLNNV